MKLLRILATAFAAATFVSIVLPATAAAVVDGGCTASATMSGGRTIDLTSITEVHLKDADVVASGQGTAPTEQTGVNVAAYVFGIPIHVYGGSGKGKGGTANGPWPIHNYDQYGRVIAVYGASDSCSGSVKIIVDDVSPVGNLVGLVATGLTIVGLAGLIGLLFARPACLNRVLGVILGLIGGIGLGVLLMQFDVLDPRNLVGLAVPAGGALAGLVLPGLLKLGGAAAATAPPA